MLCRRFRFRRYRLKQQVATAILQSHPWVFRDKVSSVLDSVEDGQWLQLLDPHEKTVGFGIFQKVGGVAIRVLRHGELSPSLAWLEKCIVKAIKKREPLRAQNQAMRILNGESDHFPGVVFDLYGNYGVLQTYHPSVDSLGRWAAAQIRQRLQLEAVVWKMPQKRIGDRNDQVRILWGAPELAEKPVLVKFREESLTLSAELTSGQKSGTFLDLRGLRRWLASQPLKDKRVLNLFAYTGSAGLACCAAGAKSVLNVDSAQQSLDFGKKHHAHPAQQWLCADIFAWLKTLSPEQKFDLIIVDPPAMASLKTQIPKALATYQRIYKQVLRHLKPGGTVVGCCCTSRISPGEFRHCVQSALRPLKLRQDLPMETDHPAKFAEAKYLKVAVFS